VFGFMRKIEKRSPTETLVDGVYRNV